MPEMDVGETISRAPVELERLLSPVSPETFARDYWGKKALHLAGEPARLRGLVGRSWDRAAFLEAVEEGFRNEAQVLRSNQDKLYAIDVLRAEFDHSRYLESGDGVRPFMPLRPNQVAPSLAAGATLRLYGLMEIDPRVRRLAEKLKAQLHYAGEVVVNGVLSPRTRGVNLHFDPEDLFLFQMAGKKRYFFSPEPVVPHPRGKGFVFGDGAIQYTDAEKVTREIGYEPWEQAARVSESDLVEVTLEPGDLLYWPAGTVHRTVAEETGESVGFLMVFLPFHFRRLLDLTLERLLLSRPEWRHVPVWTGDDRGEIPPPVREFFEARWTELKELLDSMEPAGLELGRMWHETVQPLSPVDGRRSEEEDAPGLSPEDELRLRAETEFSYARGRDREGNLGLHIYLGEREIEIESEWVPFFERLLQSERFRAAESCRWGGGEYSWDRVKEYLSALCAEGLLERLGGSRGA